MTNWPPKEIGWFATQNVDEYDLGPFKLKQDAIRAGTQAFSGQPFRVLKIELNNIDLSEWFDLDRHFLNTVAVELDENGCGGDEYGDCEPLDEITTKQAKELEQGIKWIICRWQYRNRLKLRSYWVKEVLSEYKITSD